MTKGLAYPATFGNGFQPKPVGLSDFLDANQSFVDKAQSLNQIRNVIAPQAAKKAAPQAVKKADKVFETKTIPLDASNYDDELKSIESLLGQTEDLTQEEKTLIQGAISQKRQSAFKQFGNEVNQSDLSANQKKITNIQTKELTNQPLSFGESLEIPKQKALGFSDQMAQAATSTIGNALAAPQEVLQQNNINLPVIGDATKPGLGKYLGDKFRQVANIAGSSEEAQLLARENPNVTMGAQFVGGALPFVLSPQSGIGRSAGALAAKQTSRLLPFASKPIQNFISKAVGAGVAEGITDTPLSLASTVGNVSGMVDRGEISQEEARKRLPGDIAINAVGDFAGAGLLRGAGDLAGKALKGQIKLPEMPQVETVRGESGGSAVLEKPKALTVEDIKKNTYKESKQKLDQVTQQQKQVTQAIKDAEASGDYQSVGQLKQQAQALKAEGKALKTAVNNLELEGLQGNNLPTQRVVTPNSDVVESLNRIFGDTSAKDINASELKSELVNLPQKTQQLPNTPTDNQIQGSQKLQPTEPTGSLSDNQFPLKEDSNSGKNAQTPDEIQSGIRAKAGRIEQLNKSIRGNSLEVSNLEKGGKSRRGFTVDDIPSLKEKILKDKESLKQIKSPTISTESPESVKQTLGVDAISKAGGTYVAIRKNGENVWQKVEGEELNQNLLDPEVQRMFKGRELFYTKKGIYDKKSGMQLASNIDDSLENTVARLNKEAKARGEYSTSRLINAADDKVLQDWGVKPPEPIKQALGIEGKAGGQSTDQNSRFVRRELADENADPDFGKDYVLESKKGNYVEKIYRKPLNNAVIVNSESPPSKFDNGKPYRTQWTRETFETPEQADLFVSKLQKEASSSSFKDLGESRIKNIAKEAREAQLESPTVETPKAKSLGSKVLEEGQEDNLKAIRRTLGEYTPKEFQEAQRNPSQLKKITEVYENLPKDTDRVMSQASKVKQKLNDVEASIVDNKDHLNKLFSKEGLQSIAVEINGQKYTIQKPTKSGDIVVLNSKGRADKELIYDEFQKEGKVKFDYDKGVQLAIQPTATPASKAKRFGTKTLDEAAIEHIQLLREKLVLGEKEGFLKERIMNEIAPKLQNGGLDHVWKNGEGDTSFAIKRNKRGVEFTSKEAELEFKAREEALKTQKGNVKVQKGTYGSVGLSEKQSLGLNARTKQGKVDYEAFREKVRKDTAIETALETGEVKTTKLAEDIIQKAADEWKKPDETKGKNFLTIGAGLKALFLNSDTALIGLRLFKPFVDKAFGQYKLTSSLYEISKAMIGRAESYATRLRNSKVPTLRKMIDEYNNLAGREHAAMGYLRATMNKEQVENIGFALKEQGFQALQRKIDNGYSIEGINSVEEFEALKGFLKNRSARAKLIEGTLEQAKLNNLPKEDLNTLEAFLAHETKVEKGTMAIVAEAATDFMYFRALWNNINSSTLALADPLTKLIPEYGLKKTFVSFGQIANPKVRNSPLFKAYNAGASGTFIDALTGRQAKSGLAKAWEGVKKASTFNLVAEASQDMGLLAHAQQFNDFWKKKTGQKIDILQDYNGSSDASIEFALTHNEITNKLYGSGTGNINMSELEGFQLLKPFLTFTSEPLRFQKRITEWQSIMKQAGEKNATPEMKEAGKRARNAIVSFVGLTVLLGGSTALKNYGGIVGSAYNATLNFMTDEEREVTERWVNAAQLSRYLNIDMGEKLGVTLVNRKGGQSLAKDFLDGVNGDTRLPLIDIFKQFPRDVEKAGKEFSEGEKAKGLMTTAKILFSAPARTVEKVLQKLNQEPMSVYVDTGKPFPEKAEKTVDWADVFSYSKTATDLKKQIWQSSQVKKQAATNLKGVEFTKGTKGYYPKMTAEGKEKFKADLDRYMKLNPKADRNKVAKSLIDSAKDKWLEKHPEAKKKTFNKPTKAPVILTVR